jgi:hypothetical protein
MAVANFRESGDPISVPRNLGRPPSLQPPMNGGPRLVPRIFLISALIMARSSFGS